MFLLIRNIQRKESTIFLMTAELSYLYLPKILTAYRCIMKWVIRKQMYQVKIYVTVFILQEQRASRKER